ncbi:hypothetical protein OFO07_03555 [Campylobacter sp. JMF_06 NA1]|uniref:hypothetical protein n=1 Tax=Campylobacter sp. JMF_06 NA1 TaxID=2983823 RepID=UPI0022E9E9E2|nr:hypothetical protein [Campylobacter sp. JMF_06 NA1]MDA3078001.1 hypothetical protein [Campylobacter sp. JMF_06 NA1]
MENNENLNNQNLKEKNKAIFDEMASAVKNYDPKEEYGAKTKRIIIVELIIGYFMAIFSLLNYFDYPTKANLNEAKTHIGKVVDIEIPNPSFGRRPYHNSNSCFIHFENLDGTKEKLVAKNCTYEIMPKIWKANEIKIYETPIFGMSFIYQIINNKNLILYSMTNGDLLEACSGKITFILIFILTFPIGLYSHIKLIKIKNKEKK